MGQALFLPDRCLPFFRSGSRFHLEITQIWALTFSLSIAASLIIQPPRLSTISRRYRWLLRPRSNRPVGSPPLRGISRYPCRISRGMPDARDSSMSRACQQITFCENQRGSCPLWTPPVSESRAPEIRTHPIPPSYRAQRNPRTLLETSG